MRANSLMAGLSIAVLATFAGACDRSEKKSAPVAEVQSQSPPQQLSQPMTVSGCLRAGDASDTFVLTTSEAKDGTAPATYLLASTTGLSLRENVGKRVEVSGVLNTQQRVATTTAASPADPKDKDKDKATGTSGTPMVQTQTQLDMRRLDVTNINRVGESCDTK
jgi:hypothetical protein